MIWCLAFLGYLTADGIFYWRMRRRALRAEAVVRYQHSQIMAAGIVSSMLQGVKPVVTKPPEGLTIDEAQMVLDNMYKSLHGERPN